MTDDTDEAEVRAKILAQFCEKWTAKEAERRVKLLEEAVPRLFEYAQLHNQRVDIKVHPEHLEHYVGYLQPRVRAILEHAKPVVIDRICKSHSADERIAKLIKLVNLMDEKQAAREAAKEAEEKAD